ncbi:MAG: TIM barrel protein [Armatimonadia bacterium]|nr:TIM barrel protein [Armatimonadia bacterium]
MPSTKGGTPPCPRTWQRWLGARSEGPDAGRTARSARRRGASLRTDDVMQQQEPRDGHVRFGINTLLWSASDAGAGEWVRKAAGLGFDVIEFAVFEPAEVDSAAVNSALDETGLEVTLCTIMTPERDLISDDPGPREIAKRYIRETVLLGEKLGAHAFGGPHYAPVGKLVGRGRTPEEWERAVEGLREVGRFAHDHGICLCLEPLNRFETYFLNIAADAIALVDEIDSEGVAVMLDTFHMNIEEKDPAAAIRACGDRLRHFHACGSDRGTPGRDSIGWEAIIGALEDIDYSHAAVIESFVPGIEEIAAAAAIWRDIEPSADDIAVDGLDFLRGSGL